MRSRSPPGPRCTCAEHARVASVDFTVETTAEPARPSPIEVLVRRIGDASAEWVRLEPSADGTYPLPFACTIYGWRMVS